MRPRHAIILFLTLVLSALWAGGRSYCVAEEAVVGDMNRALAMRLLERQDLWLTPDTIRSYQQNLRIEALRDKSTLTYAIGKGGNGLSSRRMRHGLYEVQGLANVSRAEIFSMSDQHALTKQSLCDSLWPKKPDASETLYTLIRRTKTILERHTDMTIVSSQGQYCLTEKAR